MHIIRPWPVGITDNNAEIMAKELIDRGIIIHTNSDWAKIDGMPCISYCSGQALAALPLIREHTDTFIFVNCMTWLFDKEKEHVKTGLITHELYQRESIMQELIGKLKVFNPDVVGNTVKPYFNASEFPFHERGAATTYNFGRISRNDASKFHKETLRIYEGIYAKQLKSGIMLGADAKVLKKIGQPPEWIKALNAGSMSQKDFYKHADFLIQPCDVNHRENLPRIAFEAMASGSLLIVDNKDGWQDQVLHGVTGWLCSDFKEFIYYATRAGYETKESNEMRAAAKLRLEENWGEAATLQGWGEYFTKIGVL